MTTPHLTLDPAKTALLVIDIQERLAPAMPEATGPRAVERAERLVVGAHLLGVPVLATEQYPRGLGPTLPSLKKALDDAGATILEKIEFSVAANETIRVTLERLIREGRRSIVLAGMEAHICVYQSARDLAEMGFSVHVALDAVCSRDPANVKVARELYRRAGVIGSSSEVVLFDLLGRAGSDTFKAISKLVR